MSKYFFISLHPENNKVFLNLMKKYLSILYIVFSVFSFGQLRDNAFGEKANGKEISSPYDRSESTFSSNGNQNPDTNTSSLVGSPVGGEQPEGPGNPGTPVPINGFIFQLLLIGICLIFYFQRKNKKINI